MYYLAEVITNKLEAHLGESIVDVRPVSGGDINDARCISTRSGQHFFVKINRGDEAYAMFQAEAKGLELLRSAAPATLVVPRVLKVDRVGQAAFLLLEYIPPQTPKQGFWTAFGNGLAQLHRATQDQFGLDHHNFIGRLPQTNQQHDTWPEFYAQQRLLPQAQLAYEHQLLDLEDMQRLERLCQNLAAQYPAEPPALIHGDLWNGNYLVHPNGRPVLIDPAAAYCHREMDLAMTRLFGGFPPEFYTAYQKDFPLAPGWEERLPLGQLYYLLVHLNLFGSSYLSSVKQILRRY